MKRAEVDNRIDTDEDFIYSKRFGFSLKKFHEKFPEGASTKIIAQSLLMTEQEVENLLENIIKKLRDIMKVDAN
jgi:hypothetical protein